MPKKGSQASKEGSRGMVLRDILTGSINCFGVAGKLLKNHGSMAREPVVIKKQRTTEAEEKQMRSLRVKTLCASRYL
jgi:hypothetical protein